MKIKKSTKKSSAGCLRAGTIKKSACAACVSFLVWAAMAAQITGLPEAQVSRYCETAGFAIKRERDGYEAVGAGAMEDSSFPQQAAWWGSLYPRIALKDAMRLVGGDGAVETKDIPVKIKWKCLDLFR